MSERFRHPGRIQSTMYSYKLHDVSRESQLWMQVCSSFLSTRRTWAANCFPAYPRNPSYRKVATSFFHIYHPRRHAIRGLSLASPLPYLSSLAFHPHLQKFSPEPNRRWARIPSRSAETLLCPQCSLKERQTE